jgi:hypothetical protein
LESLDVLDGNGNGAKMKANEQQQQQEHLKVKRISKFLSFESEQKYLCVSWFLIHRGSRNLVDMLLQITEKVFGGVELGQKLSFEQFKDLLDRIRQEIEQPNPRQVKIVDLRRSVS